MQGSTGLGDSAGWTLKSVDVLTRECPRQRIEGGLCDLIRRRSSAHIRKRS
jgi:hypothetical protein